jgi:Flp pilus assembly pilin Flp
MKFPLLFNDERGGTAIEYALIAVLIVVSAFIGANFTTIAGNL